MRSFFFLMLLISVVFIEIYLFIEASVYLHMLIIFALTFCTAIFGLSLSKKQSISAFSNLKYIGSANNSSFVHIADGVGALGAGFFLLLPGFGTDLIGLLLLVPRLRRLLLSFIFQCFLARTRTYSQPKDRAFSEPNETIIEGEFKPSCNHEKKGGPKTRF